MGPRGDIASNLSGGETLIRQRRRQLFRSGKEKDVEKISVLRQSARCSSGVGGEGDPEE